MWCQIKYGYGNVKQRNVLYRYCNICISGKGNGIANLRQNSGVLVMCRKAEYSRSSIGFVMYASVMVL